MRDQLALSELGRAALERSRSEAHEIARARVLAPHSPNTQRAYEQAYKRWTAYCDALGLPWGPIDPVELVSYLEQLSKQLAPNTIRLHLSALCELDKCCRVSAANPNPQSLREHHVVERWQESWSRQHPRAPRRRAAALERDALEQLLHALSERPRNVAPAAHVAQAARDRCLVLFGVCGAFRGAELAQLELADVEAVERGLRVRLRRSKTDQQGLGQTRGLMHQARIGLCPVEAFGRWRAVRGDGQGPLFCPISRAGAAALERALTERQITRLVATYAQRAGLPLLSAHSLRHTFATLASAKGKPIAKWMKHGGWKSPEVALSYVDQAELFDDNPSAGLLD